MEPLPTQGQTLRHYTASRPRPRRTHSQPPSSRTQEPVLKAENEASEGMGRVDEGVEEFFTKKIIPDYALKGRWEESNPAQATPSESSSTPSASTPFSSSDNITISSTSTTVTSPSAPPTDTCFTSTDAPLLSTSSTPPVSSSITTSSTSIPTKNIKKKFGDFFAFKRARAGRAAKAGGGEGGGGGGEAVKVKRTSIADLIRPLREAKERERERERDKEREKERGPRAVDDANVCNDAATTEGTAAPSRLTGDVRAMAPAKTLTTTTPSSEATPPHPATSSTPEPAAAHTGLREETVSPLPVLPGPAPSPAPCLAVTSPVNEQERMMMEMKVGGTPFGERRLKVTKRSLREGKSQSLILLTGLEPDDKKHASENTPSFEQRLQVMLHRMGVAKTPPADTKMTQNKDEELRKANSEGTILDKPEPPPTYMKPRTMSTSSADPRHPIRTSDPVRPEPLLYPKPALPERPVGPLPPKPAIAAKPHLPTPATPAGGGGGRPSSAPPSSRPEDGPPQIEILEAPRGPASVPSPRKEPLPLAPSPWRVPTATDRSEKAQSVTDESLPKPRHHMKPLPQRRAVSVHEDAFAMTQELKAVLQRSPIRFRGNRGDLPTCTEDPSSGEEAQRPQEEPGEPKGSGIREDLKADRVRMSSGSETKPLCPPEEEVLGSQAPSSTPQDQTDPPTVDTPPVPPRTTDKPPPTPTPQEKSSSTASETLQNTPLSQTPPCTSPTLPQTLQSPQVSPQDKKKSPGTAPPTVGVVNSTQEEGGAGSRQHTEKEEPADQRTESPVSE